MQSSTDHACLTRWTTGFSHALAMLLMLLAGCSTPRPPAPFSAPSENAPRSGAARPAPGVPVLPPAGSGRGGYYQDDGPGEAPPPNLQAIPDAEPKVEPYAPRGNKPYAVFGKTYTPVTDNVPMKQRGIGSWYGKKFHGQKTSSGELYDMYKMTAAHPTLPIPSYARVTNVKTGAQVIVRVNDRGPFHSSRIIDLSYTAALKLGYIGHGSTELEVERLLPDEIARINNARNGRPAIAAAPTPALMTTPTPTPTPASMPTPTPLPTPTPTSVQPTVQASTPPAEPLRQPAVASATPVSLDDFLKSQEALPEAGQIVNASTAVMTPQALAALPVAAIQTAGATNPAPGGYWLQFGAYARSANAEAMRQRLMPAWPASLPGLEVQQSGTVYRLYSGPFASRSDAMQAASLCENLSARPLVVQR